MDFSNTDTAFPLFTDGKSPLCYYGVHIGRSAYTRLYTFRYFAPSAEAVFLVSGFLSWESGKRMTRLDSGTWEVTVSTDRSLEGECYKYKVVENGVTRYVTDPFATREEGFGGNASVIATEIASAERAPLWQKASERPAPLHILEVSLASFYTRSGKLPYEKGAACRYPELAEKLVIYLKSTGYTHVKLLPREKEAHHSYFAPSPRHGTPDEFSSFVNILHQNGVGLLYSFYYPETPDEIFKIISAADYFLSHYAIDGIAFEDSPCDTEAFRAAFSSLKSAYPDKIFLTDRHKVAGALCRDGEREERLASFLTLPFEARRDAFSGVCDALMDTRSLASQSKELTRGGNRSLMACFWGSYEQKFAENRLYQMLLMMASGDKLSFMMQSLAPFRPWQDHLLPEWYMADFKLHRAHRRFVRALNEFYLATPLFSSDSLKIRLSHLDFDRLIAEFTLSDGKNERLFVINASDTLQRDYPLPVDKAAYAEIFSSDEESFAGEGYVHRMTLAAKDHRITLDLAPLSAVILQPIGCNK